MEDKEKVCTRLGVPKTSQASKYLGMPMYVGKKKKGVFGFFVGSSESKDSRM